MWIKKEGEKDKKESPSSKARQLNASHVVKIFLTWHYGSWLFSAFMVALLNGVLVAFGNWHLDNLGKYWNMVISTSSGVTLY